MPPRSHCGPRWELLITVFETATVLFFLIFTIELSCVSGYQPFHQVSFWISKLVVFWLLGLHCDYLCACLIIHRNCFILFFKKKYGLILNHNRYALLLNPLARSLEELRPEGFLNETICSIILRTALVASTVCIAFLMPFFGTYTQFSGICT